MNKIIDEFKMLCSDEEKSARLEICSTCEYMEKRVGQMICTECLCMLRWKTRAKPASCPKGKW